MTTFRADLQCNFNLFKIFVEMSQQMSVSPFLTHEGQVHTARLVRCVSERFRDAVSMALNMQRNA